MLRFIDYMDVQDVSSAHPIFTNVARNVQQISTAEVVNGQI